MHIEGNVKVREEREIEVESAEEARPCSRTSATRVVRRYQKMREEWHLGGVTIALDHTPIGDFAEFEGDGAETVAKRCGFDPDKAERRSYLRLYEELPQEPSGRAAGDGLPVGAGPVPRSRHHAG